MNHMRFADWVIIRVVHLPERTKTAIEWSAIVLKCLSIGLKIFSSVYQFSKSSFRNVAMYYVK